MALNVIAEAVLRIEYKLDLMLKAAGISSQMPMHFIGHMCPVCNHSIDYVVDIQHQVVVRRCDCKTGKVPSTIPLIPVSGTLNGEATTSAQPNPDGGGETGSRPSNRAGRKAR